MIAYSEGKEPQVHPPKPGNGVQPLPDTLLGQLVQNAMLLSLGDPERTSFARQAAEPGNAT